MRWVNWGFAVATACAVASSSIAQPGSVLDGQGCLAYDVLKSTDIRSDRRIDFQLRGGQRLRNDLAANCRSLNYEQKFDFTVAGDRICPGHEIFVPNRAWGPGEYHGSTCALGQFSPVTDGDQQ